jgi:hypothetical protein
MKTNKLIWIAMTGLSILVQFVFASCGTAKAVNSSYAESIQSNRSGYTCFLIRNESGVGVGGNCLKD